MSFGRDRGIWYNDLRHAHQQYKLREIYYMSEARILYIEDNPENRLLVKRILEAEGYTVEEAVDGSSGLQKASEVKPDLILLDINLPEIDGYDLAHQLREIPALDQTPILALTANVMKGDRERTLEAGCDGYIQKPINVDRLPDQIRNALEKAQ
jgi:two-component system cell cycle response regulator DivK